MYQIIKGWPDGNCLDMAYPADATLTVFDGVAAYVNDSGKVVAADSSAGNYAVGWLLGKEYVQNMVTVLYGDFVLEADGEHYTGTPTAGSDVYIDGSAAGKLSFTSAGTAVGKALSVDSATGKVRILWK